MFFKALAISLFYFLLSSTSLDAQEQHCTDKLYSQGTTLDGDGNPSTYFHFLDNGIYHDRLSFLKFYKRTFQHSFCNENPYQTILHDDFDGNNLADVWLSYYPNTPPLDRQHHPSDDKVLYLDENVFLEDGNLVLEILKNDPTYDFTDTEGMGQSINNPWSAGLIYTKNPYSTHNGWPIWSDHSCGCYRTGKFCARIRIPQESGANSALWFWGCGNEIDVYENFDGPSGRLKSTIHQWDLETADQDKHKKYERNFDFGDLSKDFHEYCLEWTPYKIVWSLDGEVFRTFYKFYRMEKQGDTYCFFGLDCEDIPLNETVEVWEHAGWHTFSRFPADLTIGTGIDKDEGTPEATECLVDWIDIQQKSAFQIEGPDFICDNEAMRYEVSWDDAIEWQTSENIEIVDQDSNWIDIVALSTNAPAWIEATGFENFYLAKNEYNCLRAPMISKKNIWLGKPASPDLNIISNACLNVVELNDSSVQAKETTYNWEAIKGGTFPEINKPEVIGTLNYQDSVFQYQLVLSNECGPLVYEDFVSVEDCLLQNSNVSLAIYPNPVLDHVTIVLENFDPKLFEEKQPKLQITSLVSGQVVFQTPTVLMKQKLDVRNWPRGFYFVSLILEEQQIGRKLLKVD